MTERQSAVDFILDQGEQFDPTTVPGFEERDQKGEFKGLDNAAIRTKLLSEAEMQDYNDEEAATMAEEDRRAEDREDD
jgi:hypothetical protein